MLSIGAQVENNLRKDRQIEGIKIAKFGGKYNGSKSGAKANPAELLKKYQDVSDLIKKSELSIRRISEMSGRSINTVRKVKRLVV
jgi:DNA invertase Pin-like site-specific DNA recombinase